MAAVRHGGPCLVQVRPLASQGPLGPPCPGGLAPGPPLLARLPPLGALGLCGGSPACPLPPAAASLAAPLAAAVGCCPPAAGPGPHAAGFSLPGTPAALTRPSLAASPPGGGGAEPFAVSTTEPADSKVWSVTVEYEHLLNVQRDQHALALRRQGLEVEQLRQALDLAEGGFHIDAIVERLRDARDEEVRLAVGEKCKELELYATLLRVRDRQVGELQSLCEAAPARGGGEALAEARREAEHLQSEKDELERLVVSKDRQLAAVQGVDRSMSDASALQLGAKAIEMFQDSMRQRAEEAGCERENRELRQEVDRLTARISELQADAEANRKELKEVSEVLSAKLQRGLELEQRCAELEQHLEAARSQRVQSDKGAAAQVERLHEDCGNLQALVDELKAQVSEGADRYSLLQEELSRERACSQRLERQVDEMGAQFAHAEEALAQMMQSNGQKDQLLRELTQQVSLSETKLHSYQINELMGSRHRCEQESSMSKGAPSSARKAGAHREPLARTVGLASNGCADSRQEYPQAHVVQEFMPRTGSPTDNSCVETSLEETRLGTSGGNGMSSFLRAFDTPGADLLSRSGPPEGSAGQRRRAQAAAGCGLGRSRSLASLSGLGLGGAGAAAASAGTGLDEPGRSPGLWEPRPRGAGAPASPRAARASRPAGRADGRDSWAQPVGTVGGCGGRPWEPAGAPSLQRGGAASSAAAPARERPRGGCEAAGAPPPSRAPEHPPAAPAPSYRPHPGDRVDEGVADFVNLPENGACRALFCRLGEGSYLYGTQRCSLRIGPAERLEALLLEEGGWVPVEDFVDAMAGHQGVHVQRAREAAAAALLGGGH